MRSDVAVDSARNIFIADRENHRIRKVSPDGIIRTVAGNGSWHNFLGVGLGDSGLATKAVVSFPAGVAVDRAGNLYIAEGNDLFRKVTPDGKVGTLTRVWLPSNVSVDSAGNVYVAEWCSGRVLKITPTDPYNGPYIDAKVIVSGTRVGSCFGYGADASLAISAPEMFRPQSVAFDSAGNLYIASSGTHQVLRLGSDGVVSVVAGTYGVLGFGGDGFAAIRAVLSWPTGLAFDRGGNLYIGEQYRVRRVSFGQ